MKTKKEYIAEKMRNEGVTANVNCSICSKCKGKCCKISGCGLMPCDVEDMSVDGIRRMLDTGKYSISFLLKMNPPRPMLSMISREVGRGRINPSLIRTRCSLLDENGCTLSEEERPTQALLLVPGENLDCHELVTISETISEWSKYQDILAEVIFLETGKDMIELFEESCQNDTDYLIDKFQRQEDFTSTEEIALNALANKMYQEILEVMCL